MRKELLKTRAYQIFLEEIKTQLSYAKKNFIDNEIITEQACKNAKEIFHTLKGSSGFFGFDEISGASSELEKLFANPLDQLVCSMNTVRMHIASLESLIKNLPQPLFNQDGADNA